MDRFTSSGDEDRDFVRANSHHREGNNVGLQNNRHHNTYYNQHNYHYNSRDYDTRSQSSQKSDPNSETSGRGDHSHYNLSANESVSSNGSGGGDNSRGFPHYGNASFRQAATMSASHLLNGDPAHQFPPSLYQSSADAPKSDTATVCSSSMLEDIEDVGCHYDVDSTQTSNSKQHHHHYPPPPSTPRTSNSKEGNRLVDFAERSQAVFPKQSNKSTGYASLSQESAPSNTDEDANTANALQNKKGMGPPLSRQLLLQHHDTSPFRTGSVKSGGSNTGSDVYVNVGSDYGGSLTDMQSVLSQEDAALLATANSEHSGEAMPLTGSVASGVKMDALDTNGNTIVAAATTTLAEDEKRPHPLLCDQSGSKTSGRISPGGTIYRGRGKRRYKGRFYALPLKRFHQDGVQLQSDSEPDGGSNTTNDHLHQSSSNYHHHQRQRHEDGDNYRWEDRYRGHLRDDYQRGGDHHNYHDHSSSPYKRDYDHSRDRRRNRSRSRSRSPPVGDRRREARNRNWDQSRGYKIDKNDK